VRVIEDRDRETAMTILGLSRDLIRNGVNVEETKFARIYQLPEEEIRSGYPNTLYEQRKSAG
jgi:hypothetical protein